MLRKVCLGLCALWGCWSNAAEVLQNYPVAPEKTPGADLRILSYNILAKRWGQNMRSVELRAPDIIEIIKNIAPDIAGLQELDAIWYELLEGKLKPLEFARDPYDTNMCAVLYDSRKFRQLDGGVMEFTNNYIRCLRWVLLEESVGKRKLLVTNTHWDLTVPKRMQNSDLMVRYLAELQKKFPGVPVISTGDFNCISGSREYKNLLKNSTQADAVDTAEKVENRTLASCNNPKRGKIRTNYRHIDHILVPQGTAVKSARLLYGELPMKASDHLPLIADIKLDNK